MKDRCGAVPPVGAAPEGVPEMALVDGCVRDVDHGEPHLLEWRDQRHVTGLVEPAGRWEWR